MEAGGCCSLRTKELVSKMLHQHLEGETKSLKLNIQDPGLVSNCFKLDNKGLNYTFVLYEITLKKLTFKSFRIIK